MKAGVYPRCSLTCFGVYPRMCLPVFLPGVGGAENEPYDCFKNVTRVFYHPAGCQFGKRPKLIQSIYLQRFMMIKPYSRHQLRRGGIFSRSILVERIIPSLRYIFSEGFFKGCNMAIEPETIKFSLCCVVCT